MYSAPAEHAPLPWPDVDAPLRGAGTYGITAIEDAYPHPRPVWGVWVGERLHLSVGSPVVRRLVSGDPREAKIQAACTGEKAHESWFPTRHPNTRPSFESQYVYLLGRVALCKSTRTCERSRRSYCDKVKELAQVGSWHQLEWACSLMALRNNSSP